MKFLPTTSPTGLFENEFGGLHSLEHRRLRDPGSNERAERQQHDAGKEGNAPAPGLEIGFGKFGRKRKDQRCEHQSDRKSDLNEAAVEPAFAGRRVLDNHQGSAAPFAAKADALDDAQQNEKDRRKHADGCVVRKQADAERAQPHDEHGQHQHRLASEAIAKMAEQRAAERSRQKAHSVGAERRQRAGQRVDGRKEGLVEYERRRGRINQEIIPLDDGADAARKYDRSHFRASRSGVSHGRRYAHFPLLVESQRNNSS